MWAIHLSDDPDSAIRKFAEQGKPVTGLSPQSSFRQKQSVIAERYRDFQRRVPTYNTQQLWYQPRSWSVWHMITAAFAHASWSHIVGNLFFFIAFAVTVEVIIGPLLFAAVILSLAIGTHTFYSLAMLGTAQPLPTVGLSGVVMGVMALFAFFLPHGRIKCFFWFLVYFRVFAVPAWLLFAWYAGWDTYELLVTPDQRSGVNLVAHVSGAAIGYLVGVAFFRSHRKEMGSWQPHERYST
jgi:membrane associated rhomboid family serine protease